MTYDELMAELRRQWERVEWGVREGAWGMALAHLEDVRRLVENERAVRGRVRGVEGGADERT